MCDFAVFAWLATAMGCDGYGHQMKRFEQHLRENRVGEDPNVWIVTRNAFGQYEKVAVVFGYADDRAFCGVITETYMQRYPGVELFCDTAN